MVDCVIRGKYREGFHKCIKDLLLVDSVQELEYHLQHVKTDRLQHCVDVAYVSYKLAKRFGLDYRAAARAGLLHDYFLYDWKTEVLRGDKRIKFSHTFKHPKVALQNARKITELNAKEENIILSHMFPMSRKLPRSREAYIVTMVDKYCTIKEVAKGIKSKRRETHNYGIQQELIAKRNAEHI